MQNSEFDEFIDKPFDVDGELYMILYRFMDMMGGDGATSHLQRLKNAGVTGLELANTVGEKWTDRHQLECKFMIASVMHFQGIFEGRFGLKSPLTFEI
jgi:hypothetical protein